MPEKKTSQAEPGTEITYVLTDEDKAKVAAATEHIKTVLGGKAEPAPVTDPGTRPTFGEPGVAEPKGADDADLAQLVKRYDRKTKKGGYLPYFGATKAALTRETDPTEDELKAALSPYINLFPKGEFEDNFRIERWAAALERSRNTLEGSTAFSKWAPWESAYYEALTKAQGDMVSGQDGGFLAPEVWSNRFIDQIYASQALARLGPTVIPMPSRVTHLPRLNGAVTVSYGQENAALTASQAAFQQVSFTARKQYVFVQMSNELIRDSDPAALDVIMGNAIRWAAIDRDKQAIIGTGQAGTPTGLMNTGGIGVASGSFASAGAPVFTELITGMANVENLNNSANVPVGQTVCTGVFGPTALKAEILSMKDSQNRPIYDYGLNYVRGSNAPDASASSMIDGLLGIDTWAFSNALGQAANSRDVIFGQWEHLYLMVRQDVEVLTSNVAGTAFQNDQTWLRLIARYDVGVAHPEAFYAFTNG